MSRSSASGVSASRDRKGAEPCFLTLCALAIFTVSCTTGTKVIVPEDLGPSIADVASDQSELADLQPDVAVLELVHEIPGTELSAPDMGPEVEAPEDIAVDSGPTACAAPEQCDDGDECTFDDCVENLCFHAPMPGSNCCDDDEDCNDSVDCTNDFCAAGKCLHTKKTNLCCSSPSDCDDSDPCTQDVCAGNTCGNVFYSSHLCQCQSFLECDDGLDCTDEFCDDGTCVYEQLPGALCCLTHNECDDGDALTFDQCVQHTCSHTTQNACFIDAHCDDMNPCTTDNCQNNQCAIAAVPSCCTVDGQCEDGQPLTFNLCIDNQCRTSLTEQPETCTGDEECADESPCTQETCVSGMCFVTIDDTEDCCFADNDCDNGDPCTAGTCQQLVCVQSALQGAVPQIAWTFDTVELDGFAVETDNSNVYWQASDKGFISAPYSLYFGDPSGPTIDNGKQVSGTALSPEVTLPASGPVSLQAWTFVDIEPLYSMDLLTLTIVSGDTETVIWSKEDINGSTAGSWKELEVQLEPQWPGNTVQFRFSFNSVDNKNNDYQGIYFDDVRLLWACP